MIGYLGACIAVAGFLTIIFALFRPIQSRGEMKSWRTATILFVVVSALPYLWAEILTRAVGSNMEARVKQVLSELEIPGGLQFYRVIGYSGKRARVIAVGLEYESWGGADRPVVAITMGRSGNGWRAESYTVVTSSKRNMDGSTLPPYW